MAKMTLLEMTQDILNDMDSDPVNSIDDTVESAQVAQIIKTTYFNITAQRDWPFLKALSALTGLADASNPTKMQIPATVNKILWLKYNKKDVTYKTPKDFLDLIQARDVSLAEVDANGYRTDGDPVYWTTYDDEFVTFDSRDSDVDTTLQTSKSSLYATTIPTWSATDGFIPTLPEKMFTTLLAGAKATCFRVLKQVTNDAAESFAGRGLIRAQNEAHRTKDAEGKSNTINYGRK